MLTLAGPTGYDPLTRRRVRRVSARARPWLLPVALVAAALLVPLRAWSPPVEVVAAPSPAQAPPGRVLVAVTPSDPAVLGLARPGASVDVYAAAGPSFEAVGDRPARRVAVDALVVDAGDGSAADGVGSASGPLAPAGAPAGAPSGPGAVTLAVTDAEAAALAAHPGSGLVLAVRAPGPQPSGAAPPPPPGSGG